MRPDKPTFNTESGTKFHVYIFYLVIPLVGTCPEGKLDNMPNVVKEYSRQD